MEQLSYMVTFARVVQAGSFAGAAKRMDVTTSVVSKHVAKLEKLLGAKLLHRSTRTLSLTETGSAYLEHCIRVADEFEDAERAVTRLQSRPTGLLRVSAPPTLVTHQLVPHLNEFHLRYPEVRVEFDLSNRLVDLAEDGFDMALRIARTPSPALATERLAVLRSVICASPAYIKRRGAPRTEADLIDHDCLVFSFQGLLGGWKMRLNGNVADVPVRGLLSANTVEPLRLMALEGLGIVQLPTFVVGADIQQGRLVRLLEGYEPTADVHLFAVYRPQPFVPPKLRCFIDFIAERFGQTPYWDQGLFASSDQH